MAARHLASVEPGNAGRPSAEIPGNPFEGRNYPRAYLKCLDVGHEWRNWRLQNGVRDRGAWRPQWTRRALWCRSCGTERTDTLNEWGELERRRYTTPPSRKIEGFNLGQLRPEARVILLAEAKPDPEAPAHDPAGWDE